MSQVLKIIFKIITNRICKKGKTDLSDYVTYNFTPMSKQGKCSGILLNLYIDQIFTTTKTDKTLNNILMHVDRKVIIADSPEDLLDQITEPGSQLTMKVNAVKTKLITPNIETILNINTL